MSGSELTFKKSMDFAYGEPAPIAPGVVRIVADNPSPMTFKGTNTYLVGSMGLAVIDPGPDSAAHRQAILDAAGARPITHIFVTHAHHDHVDGVPALAARTGAIVCGIGRDAASRKAQINPLSSDFIDFGFTPDRKLSDGETIKGADWALTAIHTPGHAPDHLCFALEGRGILFSGDHVMAWNTTVVAPPEGRMADYLASLQRLMPRTDTVYLPGHGGRILEPQRTVKAYLLHRRWREQAVLDALRDGPQSARAILPRVYPGINGPMARAALLSVIAHAEYLIERGVLASDGPLHPDSALSQL
jgi:glyoxylase-like metal-dependent hydrolase (beta-lactamase superfamily II)